MGVNSCSESLETKFKEVIKKYNMLEPRSCIIAAVSGGADSVCLLHLLVRTGYMPYVVHINHMIRGEEADRDALFVSELCKKLGLEFCLIYKDAPKIAQDKGLSLEQAARECRYEALFEKAKEIGANRIAVAHNQNDQAETVLLRLIRGTGLTGLTGMTPVRADGIIRPLLFFSRAQIEEYCHNNRLAYVTDSTNLSEDYSRNYVRRKILPAMQELNPCVYEAIARSASLVSCDEEYISKNAQLVYADICSKHGDKIHIDALKLAQLDKGIARRVVRRAVKEVCGLIDVTEGHIEGVLELCKAQTGKSVHLKRGGSAIKSYDLIIVGIFKEREEFCVSLDVGTFALGESVVSVSRGRVTDFAQRQAGEERIDEDKLPEGAVLRNRREGDRIHPLGAPGERKLKDFFIDKKVPREERDKLILLAVENEILAVMGRVVSEKVKVDQNTKNIIAIKADRGI